MRFHFNFFIYSFFSFLWGVGGWLGSERNQFIRIISSCCAADFVSELMIGGGDACQADSGGPLIKLVSYLKGSSGR